MRPPPEKPLWYILKEKAGNLGKLVTRSDKAHDIQSIVLNELPHAMREHVVIATFKAGQLTLAVSSAAWHHQLRFQIPNLIEKLRKNGLHNLIGIQLKVDPKLVSKPKATAQLNSPQSKAAHANLSADNREQMQAIADGITDPELKKALQDLSEN